MDHHTRSLRDHRWDERPIEPHRRKQVLVQCPIPLGIVQHREAACRCRRAANDMDNDFYPTESFPNGLRDGDTAFGSRKIGGNKLYIRRERTGFLRAVVRTLTPASRSVATIACPRPCVPPVTSAR